MVITGRERDDLIQPLALDPELVFAGRITGVFAAFEHGAHHDFDGYWLVGRRGLGRKQDGGNCVDDQNPNAPRKNSAHGISYLLICLIRLLCCASRE
jgi:hypothetical protein